MTARVVDTTTMTDSIHRRDTRIIYLYLFCFDFFIFIFALISAHYFETEMLIVHRISDEKEKVKINGVFRSYADTHTRRHHAKDGVKRYTRV